MAEIAESSKRIEEIINVIDDIASKQIYWHWMQRWKQPVPENKGKGFAVVAGAFGRLAQRSSSAAKIFHQCTIPFGVEKTDRGALGCGSKWWSIEKNCRQHSKMNTLNNEISAASQQQSDGISQISQALNDIDHATQKMHPARKNLSSTSETMNSISRIKNGCASL